MIGRAAALVAALLLAVVARAGEPVRVDIEHHDGVFHVEVDAFAPVPRAVAWEVMTDYDHMTRFVPNLLESRVTARDGARWTVAQKGFTRIGPFELAWDSVREITLVPLVSTESRRIGGKTKRSHSRLDFADAPGGSRIHYQTDTEPGYWIPAFITSGLISSRIREHFELMIGEMKQRHAQASAAAAPAPTEGVSSEPANR